MKRFVCVLLALLSVFMLTSCKAKTTDVAATEAVKYVPKNYNGSLTMKLVKSLDGGIESHVKEDVLAGGYDYVDFEGFFEMPREKITAKEQSFLENMRKKQLVPNSSTLMQKIVTARDMAKYVGGDITTVKGFVTSCADSKSLDNVYKLYYGLRLDYSGSKFSSTDTSVGVIRFYAENADKCEILKQNNGTEVDHPNCLAGFTSAIKQNVPQPAWYFSDNIDMRDKAELYELYANGDEILRAVYSKSQKKFIPVDF